MAETKKGFTQKFPILTDIMVVAVGVFIATMMYQLTQTHIVPKLMGSTDVKA
jgi:hypothetical protein